MTGIEEPKWWRGTPGTLRWAFARIRALEAELAENYRVMHAGDDKLLARAEKAEAEVADLYQRMWAQNDRAEKAEAESGARKGASPCTKCGGTGQEAPNLTCALCGGSGGTGWSS